MKELYILYRVGVVSVFGSVLDGQNGTVGPMMPLLSIVFGNVVNLCENGFRLRRGSISVASRVICYL